MQLSFRATRLLSFACAVCVAATTQAQLTPFNLAGNAGEGLLPGNEVGNNTANSGSSSASGGEVGDGFVFDASTNMLDFAFDFEGLTGGLADVAGGIHIHRPSTPGDPFNSTGGIAFFLNNGSDPAVSLDTPQVAIGATSGSLAGTIDFGTNTALIDALLAGELYLNIHTAQFGGGELRGTLVPIPEPTAVALSLLGVGMLAGCRRRR